MSKMTSLVRSMFTRAIQEISEIEFQRFVTRVFLAKHGPEGFLVMREHKDKGCDGIVIGEKAIVAAYGPKKYEQKAFERKAGSDFDKYEEHWGSDYPGYRYVCNHDLAPDQVKFIKKRKEDTDIPPLL